MCSMTPSPPGPEVPVFENNIALAFGPAGHLQLLAIGAFRTIYVWDVTNPDSPQWYTTINLDTEPT